MTDPAAPSVEERDPSQYVSYSALTLHRTCPQAWAYRYIRRLARPDFTVRPEADFGSWWHALRDAEAMQRGVAMDSLRYTPKHISTGDGGPTFDRAGDPEAPVSTKYRLLLAKGETYTGTFDLTPEIVLEAARDYWQRIGPEARETWEERLGVLPDRLEYVNDRWHEEYADDIAHEAPLGIEVKFKRVLPGTDAVLPGYVDLVYFDTRRSLTVVRDSKTAKKIDAAEAAEDLQDSQLHNYAWGAAPKVKDWGYTINALSYDRVRSVGPKTPVLTATGTLSKSVTDYDLHTYRTFAAGPEGLGVSWGDPESYYVSGAKKGQPKFGRYTEDPAVIARLDNPAARSAWFTRTLVPLNRNVVIAHLRAAVDTQADAARTVERFRQRGEASRNFTRNGCRWCDFASLCRAEMYGGVGGDYPLADHGLVQR